MTDNERMASNAYKAAWRREKRRKLRGSSEEEKRQEREKNNRYYRTWYNKNNARILTAQRLYREKNVERLRAYWRDRYAKNRSVGFSSGAAAAEIRVRLLNQDVVFAAANKAVPRGIPSWKRDDIISDIVLAVLEGSLAIEEIAPKATEFVRRFNRQFSEYLHSNFDESFMGAVTGHGHVDKLEGTL